METFEVVIGAGETLHITSGWTELELDPDAVYLLPVKVVKLVPGLHVLRPVGEAFPSGAVRVTLMQWDRRRGEVRR